MSHRPGGGPSSRQVVRKPVRTGAPAKAARPAGVAQIGLSYGTHITEKRKESSYRGEAVFGGGDVMASKFIISSLSFLQSRRRTPELSQ